MEEMKTQPAVSQSKYRTLLIPSLSLRLLSAGHNATSHIPPITKYGLIISRIIYTEFTKVLKYQLLFLIYIFFSSCSYFEYFRVTSAFV